MKITKRKWGTQQPLFFYRDMIAGRLTEQPDRQGDFADLLFEEQTSVAAVFETSLQSRLLKTDDKGPKYRGDRGIIELVASLCQSGNLSENLDKIKCLPQQEAEKLCQQTLSGYGTGFTAAGSTVTLYEALLLLMAGDNAQRAEARAELEKIQKTLLEEKTKRMARVRTSIKGNKIPLQIRDGSITANTNRAAWLLELLQTNGEKPCYSALDDMEKIFPFERLAGEINRKLSGCKGGPQTIAKTVDEAVRTYRRSLWERYPEQRRDMKYYFQALQEYFKENFPIRTKREGARKRQEMLGDGTARARLLEPEHMQKAVRRRLINQSTQLHILYGKLYEYCCTGSRRLPVNSDTLQTIQVLEAVKKQVMTAVLWSVSRLNYFYDYQCSEDILSKKDFRNKYLYECNEKDFEACREKLRAFFPLVGVINRNYCTALLEACTDCIRALRVRIFHFKNLNFIEVLEQAAENIIAKKDDEKEDEEKEKRLNLIKQLYQQDLKHLQKVFMQRISSMNLPLYYPSELLLGIFANSGKSFTLYSADCQMTPSFRKVYERGKNLSRNNCGLRWFRQLEDEWETEGVNVQATADADAQRAVRNLLQLIYDYCFLPAVQENETLVTGCISEVLARNRQIANESGRPRAAGYSEIQALYREGGPGMRLKDLMEQMQRLISQTEQENRELARNKTDYAQRFLREVYAMAFNNFLDTQYPKYCNDVVFPRKNCAAAKGRIEESSLPCLHTSLTEDIGGYLLVLYPVLRLLDGRELSEFQHQMLRYRTAMAKLPDGEKWKSAIKMVEKIEELTELVKLMEPIPVNAKEAWRNRALETFSPFIEGNISEYSDFYLQNDNLTPVFHRNMIRLLRSGVLDVYKAVPGMRKQATPEDYKAVCDGQWVMQSTDERPITFVEYVQSELQRLHRKYETSRFRSLSREDRASYCGMLHWLDNYNQARRNLTFETLYGVCRIHLETMSRWVGFAQDWERDMYFLLVAWIKQGKLQRLTEAEVNKSFTKGKVVYNLRKYLKKKDSTAFRSIYCLGADEEFKFAEVRNVIAHLDLLRRSGWESETESRRSTVEGYLDCLDRLRILLSYDQKRMNAVTKTMQKILEEQMISAEFTMKAKGKLELERLQPMLIEHLKKSKSKDKIIVPSRGETFLKTLESLMKYRNPGSLT